MSSWLDVDSAFIPLQAGAAQLLDLLNNEGEHPNIMLRKTRLFNEDFALPNKLIQPRQLAQLYFNSTLTRHHELPFQLGKRILPSALAHFSSGLLHAPNLSDALDYLCLSNHHWTPLLQIQRYSTTTEQHLFFRDPFGCLIDDGVRHFVVSYTIEALRCLCDWLAGEEVSQQWHYEVPLKDEQQQLNCLSAWGERCTFATSHYCLTIPNEQSQTSLKMASANVFNMQHALLKSQRQYSLMDLLRGTIQRNLDDVPTLDESATQLGLSPATLKRKLKHANSSYQRLVDDVRAETSFYLASKLHLAENEIARQLCFYDVSNFRRAMKRWLAISS